MKTCRFIALLAATLLCAAASFSQAVPSGKVPAEVLGAFMSRYPDASDVIWIKKANFNYEASFMMAEQKEIAEFEDDGIWVETENPIRKPNLPLAVKNAVMVKSPTCKIADAEEVQTADRGKVYEVGCSVKKAGKTDYRITTDGTLIGMVDKK